MPAYRIGHSVRKDHGHGWESHVYRATFLNKWRALLMPLRASVRIELNPKNHFDINSAKIPDFLMFKFNRQTYTIEHHGQDLMQWLREHLVGRAELTVSYSNIIDMDIWNHAEFQATMVVNFTHKGDATMFKLVHGIAA